ncbi:MAG: alanine racemase [Kiritimatiellae bacterium]|jgi:alanine racemase|nr:alanine racemase [Kiritimatiellia bacterium]
MEQLVKAYISRSALRRNVRLIQKTAAGAPLCAMVKADAYGHGAALVVKALQKMKIKFWGVATLNEALELRGLKVREPIIVMRPFAGYAPARELTEQINLMRRMEIRPSLANDDVLALIAKTSAAGSKPLYAHIKADTGMGRSGCLPDEIPSLLLKAAAITGMKIEGIYSHPACADDKNYDCMRGQLAVFNAILDQIKSLGFNIPLRHMANSSAVFRLPAARFDLVRPGRAIYGYRGRPVKGADELVPAMRIEAPLVLVKWVKKGTACGYGHTFRFKRRTRIGLLPLGYADGYSRQWSNKGMVGFRGKLAPVIGRVSMDLTIVDLTDMQEAVTGSSVCVVSNRREDPHSMESMAGRLGTIPHEIGCGFGRRIQRVPAA